MARTKKTKNKLFLLIDRIDIPQDGTYNTRKKKASPLNIEAYTAGFNTGRELGPLLLYTCMKNLYGKSPSSSDH